MASFSNRRDTEWSSDNTPLPPTEVVKLSPNQRFETVVAMLDQMTSEIKQLSLLEGVMKNHPEVADALNARYPSLVEKLDLVEVA